MQTANKVAEQTAKQATENIKLNEATAEPSEAQIERCTQILSEETHSIYLFGMYRSNALGDMPYESFRRHVKNFCDTVLEGIDKPNPLLTSMVRQAAIFDQVIAKLCSDGAQEANPEIRRSDLQQAANLASEFRRSMAAILTHCATAIEKQDKIKAKVPKN